MSFDSIKAPVLLILATEALQRLSRALQDTCSLASRRRFCLWSRYIELIKSKVRASWLGAGSAPRIPASAFCLLVDRTTVRLCHKDLCLLGYFISTINLGV